MDISKEDFIKLTTEGYPVTLEHDINEFYEIIADFVNQQKDNNFFANVDDGVEMHAGMKTEVCKVVYDKGNVKILSRISTNNENSTTGEFSLQEEFQILGHACLGILYFCDMYAMSTGQNAHFGKVNKKSDIAENKKYNIWPM